VIRVALRENSSASRDAFIADENARASHDADGAVRFRAKRTADTIAFRMADSARPMRLLFPLLDRVHGLAPPKRQVNA
jgi:hypothetical protein